MLRTQDIYIYMSNATYPRNLNICMLPAAPFTYTTLSLQKDHMQPTGQHKIYTNASILKESYIYIYIYIKWYIPNLETKFKYIVKAN